MLFSFFKTTRVKALMEMISSAARESVANKQTAKKRKGPLEEGANAGSVGNAKKSKPVSSNEDDTPIASNEKSDANSVA